jgi:hypothetical protein
MAQNASDSQKVDYLWKKIVYGAAKTDISGNIDATNEPNPSPLLIRGDKILQQASSIANVIPGSNSSVVTVYPTTFPVECISTAGIPTPTLTWQTGRTFWVPPEFGSTYQIKVYISPSGQAANVTTKGTQVFATGSGNNDLWVFDYQSGILNFNSNNTPYNASNQPISFTGNSVYISGAVYSGTFGLPAAVSIGNLTVSNTTISTSFLNANIYISPTGNGTVQFGGNLAVGIPSGNTLQRPTSPIIGYVRYNTETQQFEIYNGSNWVAPGTATITSDVITPDGVGNTFTLSSTSTTTGVMVNINGTMQQPFTAYNVSGTSITFTEIPLSTDIVEVRHIVVGAATVSAESLILGDTSVILDTAGNVNVTGNLVVSGNYFYANGRSIFGYNLTQFTATAQVTTNSTLIDSLPAAGNTSVNWTLSSVDNVNNNFRSSMINSLNNGTNIYFTEYGVIQNNNLATVATFSSNIVNGNIQLWAYGISSNVTVAFQRDILGTSTPYGYITQGTIGPVGPAGPAGTIGNTSSVIQSTSNTPSTTTSTGALIVTGGAGIGGNLNVGGPINTIAGNLTLTGNLLPSSNVTYDLGSPSVRWRTGYFSASTIDLGGSTIGVGPNGFQFTVAGSNPVYLSGNGAILGNTVSIPGNLSLGSGLLAANTTGAYGQVLLSSGNGVFWGNVNEVLYNNSGIEVNANGNFVNVFVNNQSVGGFAATIFNVPMTTPATSTVTGALQVAGGAGIGGNVFVGGNIVISGPATAGAFVGVLNTAAQPNITSIGALGNLTVTGNITSSGYYLGNIALASGYNSYSNIQVATYLPTYSGNISGTLQTANQPNITSVGALTSLSVTGSINSGAITSTGIINTSGNILAAVHSGGSVSVTGLINTLGNVIAANVIATNIIASNIFTAANSVSSFNGNTQIMSLGVGTLASGATGEIRATNAITSYYSDERLKTKLGVIENALDKVDQLTGFYYEANDIAQGLGFAQQREVGVSAQSTQTVLPEIVKSAPISDEYLTVQYERFAPLLIEAIKELRQEVNAIKKQLGE